MPTYEYRCAKCRHEFEEFQSMTAKPLRRCPQCGKPALQRLIGAGAGVLFKGSGFWQTDYRTESYKEAAKKDAPPAESKSDSKPESKPETKPESKPKSESKPESKPDKPSKKPPKASGK
jgi:putative FmdB family regulatory protein